MTFLTVEDSSTSASITPVSEQLLETDVLGRLRITREHRQALLKEYDHSGTSAAQFAKLAGLKYSTFAAWVRRHRRRRQLPARAVRKPLRLVEAVVTPGAKGLPRSAPGLLVQLPGGVRVELTSEQQAPLVAALVQALASRC